MLNQFQRTEALIGKEAQEKLKNSKIIIFGLGGVGSYCLEALTRIGIENIDIVDNDKISITNLNRQLFALHSTVGKYKTDVAFDRMKDINPKIKINKFQLFFDEENINQFNFSQYNYVIDAIDSVKSKIKLIEQAKKYNVPIICAMGAGNKTKPTEFLISDISKTSVCPLARIIRLELKKRNIKNVKVVFSKELPINKEKNIISSNSYTPSAMGLIIASVVVEDIINKM